MSSKDKETKSIQDKLKQFFKGNKGNLGNFRHRDFELNADIERELNRGASITTRIKAIKELSDAVLTNKLADTYIEKIWSWVKDLLEYDQPPEIRHLVFSFLENLIKGQRDRLGVMRAHFFRVIKQHNHPDDILHRFELLKSLTDNGKDILYFEEEVGPFLLAWLPEVTRAGKSEQYLEMLIRVIKFNAAYLEYNVFTEFIHHVCMLPCNTKDKTVVLTCLEFLDTIVAYSNLPSDSLPKIVGVLCRTVNGEAYCFLSWKIMRNLLGTHMGHSALFTMCRILQEPCFRDDIDLLRGAVFYIKMALWSNHQLPNLNCPPTVVLCSVLECIKCNQPILTYEVILALQSLINKHGVHLHNPAWDTILNILSIIVKQLDSDHKKTLRTVAIHLHDTLNSIESFIEHGTFNGSTEKFFEVIQECSTSRPESSILKLISYLSQNIIPTKHRWLTNLNNLLNNYFKGESRTNIRLKALDVLFNTVKVHRRQYGDELLDKIVIPHLASIYTDPDIVVRTEAAKLLIDMCMNCETKRCLDILDILEKLLNRPYTGVAENVFRDSDVYDVKEVVSGLIDVFAIKIHHLPSLHAVRIFKMFIKHLEMHYERPKILENCNSIRSKIFEYFLKIRADSNYHLGCPDAGRMKFSSYLCVTYRSTEKGPLASPPPASPAITQHPNCTVTYISMVHAFHIVITCLKLEKDWKVLNLVLQELPNVLQNKTLILSKHENNEVGILVNRLCTMITEKGLPDTLNAKITKPDFHAAILPVLSSLASYHAYLDSSHQQQMIRCLYKFCIGPRSSRHCITALTTCTLEMSDVMVKMLPDVLLTLSKISATVHIAIPILEFLSTITILPNIYASFVGDQYMAIFAISLPYTNPFKYNHYTVSLAHHVIAVWFLKCRLPFRKDFVRFITNGLQTNVLIPFEETNALKMDLSKLNQDSSDRKRSSSLTEQSSRSRERTATVVGRMDKSKFDFKPSIDKALHTFYEELTETCIDLMARYTYSPSSALPRRLPTAEFLLNGGQSMSWLLGNKVITVTTSGCAQKSLKQGLCDKCYNICKANHASKTPECPRLSKGMLGGSSERDREESASTRITRQNSGEKSNNNTSASSPLEEGKRLTDKLDLLPQKLQQLNLENTKNEKHACACWCQSWAEIHIRRPTGDMSWMMRIQNQISHQQTMYDFPLNELSKLFSPSLQNTGYEYEHEEHHYPPEIEHHKEEEEMSSSSNPISIPNSPNKFSTSRQSSRDSIDDDVEQSCEEKGGKSRNLVRRSNSSPEMSANWKHPFLSQKPDIENADCKEEDVGKKKNYCKDMRVSCEAIPEEIAGMSTTPPNDALQQQQQQQQQQPNNKMIGGQMHPSLLSCHSYPGSSPPHGAPSTGKLYQTVPTSPNTQISVSQPLLLTNYPSRNSSVNSLKSKSLSTESNSSEKGNDSKFEGNLPISLAPLTTKPPQSPTQTSPRPARHNILPREKDGHEIQKSSSFVLEKPSHAREKKLKKMSSNELGSQFEQNNQRRDRVHTISVMSPIHKPKLGHSRSKDAPKSGINPSFVFLQLYHMAQFGTSNERPLLVNSSEIVQRALKVLDCIPPYETHKIGVIYVRGGQCGNETEILRNKFGSVRYVEFLRNLGTLIKLQDVDPQVFFLGGLEQSGADGKFAYIWQDDIIRVMFHVATLMPNKETDPQCTNKKLHIGNNNVTIVYNESGEEYNIKTLAGQFNFASIIVQPLDHNTNKVTVKAKEELADLIGNCEPNIVSDQNVSILARQLALHANLASLVFNSLQRSSQDPYASNWLERLRKIKNLRNKIIQECKKEHANQMDDSFAKSRKGQMEDFTEYT